VIYPGPVTSKTVKVSSDLQDSLVVKGTEIALLRFEGLPINTVCAEIKYIFHLEGTASINLDTVLTSATEPIVSFNLNAVDKIRSDVGLMDSIRIVPTESGLNKSMFNTSMLAKMGL